jgi:hypothetical protein
MESGGQGRAVTRCETCDQPIMLAVVLGWVAVNERGMDRIWCTEHLRRGKSHRLPHRPKTYPAD